MLATRSAIRMLSSLMCKCLHLNLVPFADVFESVEQVSQSGIKVVRRRRFALLDAEFRTPRGLDHAIRTDSAGFGSLGAQDVFSRVQAREIERRRKTAYRATQECSLL